MLFADLLSLDLVTFLMFFILAYSKSDGVLCFHYSRMHIVNDTYHVSALRCRDKNIKNVARHRDSRSEKTIETR